VATGCLYGWRMSPISFKRHRFPPTIIQHTIWLYARFTLSFRDVEELLAERGIDVSNETVRRWFLKFGRLIAGNLRRSRPRPSPHWHLDEMVIKIRDRKYWLWRAVDDEGEVLDFLVQRRRCARSAGRLLRKLLKKQGFAPTRITADKLKSYPVAIREQRLCAVHDQGLRANNRAENSHQPVRRRERKQQRFKSPGSAQRFLSIYAAVQNAFYVQRHLLPRRIFKAFRAETFVVWRQSCLAA
jgi:putative transposase